MTAEFERVKSDAVERRRLEKWNVAINRCICLQVEMGRCGFVLWLVLACLTSDALQQYREKNISE